MRREILKKKNLNTLISMSVCVENFKVKNAF